MYRSNRCRVERVKLTTLTPFQTPLNATGNHPGGVAAVGGYSLTTLDPDKANTVCMGLKPGIRNDASVQKPAHGRRIVDMLPLTIGRAEHRRWAVSVHGKACGGSRRWLI